MFGLIDDPDNGRKLVVRGKNNLGPDEQKKKSLAFRFDTKQVGTDPRNGKPIVAPFIKFDPGYVDVTASEALGAVNDNKSPTMREGAKQFLRDLLTAAEGRRMPAADVAEAAEAEGISKRTLARATPTLKVRAEKDEKKWYWVLPEDAAEKADGDDHEF